MELSPRGGVPPPSPPKRAMRHPCIGSRRQSSSEQEAVSNRQSLTLCCVVERQGRGPRGERCREGDGQKEREGSQRERRSRNAFSRFHKRSSLVRLSATRLVSARFIAPSMLATRAGQRLSPGWATGAVGREERRDPPVRALEARAGAGGDRDERTLAAPGTRIERNPDADHPGTGVNGALTRSQEARYRRPASQPEHPPASARRRRQAHSGSTAASCRLPT
jgi:hypothetical protein